MDQRTRATRAIEELCAEFAATMVCARVGVKANLPMTADSITSWKRVLPKAPWVLYDGIQQGPRAAPRILVAPKLPGPVLAATEPAWPKDSLV